MASQAFQEFMLRGKTTPAVANSSPTRSTTPINREEVIRKKTEKIYWKTIKAFQRTLERDWLDVDDNLEQVVDSIAHLRGRVAMESKFLASRDNEPKPPWEGHGYRSHSQAGMLSVEDVELALSHDLRQHERLLGGARTLLASLSQAQDALGRRLEELMLFHLDTTRQEKWDKTVDAVQLIFSSLAIELYRKQVLIQSLIDSVNDRLLVDLEEGDNDFDGSCIDAYVNPRKVAEKCSQEWPRGSKASSVNAKVLDEFLRLGDHGDEENKTKV